MDLAFVECLAAISMIIHQRGNAIAFTWVFICSFYIQVWSAAISTTFTSPSSNRFYSPVPIADGLFMKGLRSTYAPKKSALISAYIFQ